MELKCTDCMVTFEAPYDKDCPFCGTDAFVVEITNQPKLSIPKKIAEMLDELEYDWDMMVFRNISEGDYQELFDYIDRGNSPIIMTYLAGKALGVKLVEVVE